VSAYSPIHGDSYKKVTINTTGQREDAPTLTTDKSVYSSSDIVSFEIDTSDAEELFIDYNYYNDAWSSSHGTKTISPTENMVSWDFEIPDNQEGYTFEFKFSVRRNGKWTKWQKITILIPEE